MIFNRLINHGNIIFIENELKGDKLLAYNGIFNIEISSKDYIIGKIKSSFNKRKYTIYDSSNKIVLKIYLNCWYKSGYKKMIIQKYINNYDIIEYVSYPSAKKNGNYSTKNLKFVKKENGNTIFEIYRCLPTDNIKSNEYNIDYDNKVFDLFEAFCISLVCIHCKPIYDYNKNYDGKL